MDLNELQNAMDRRRSPAYGKWINYLIDNECIATQKELLAVHPHSNIRKARARMNECLDMCGYLLRWEVNRENTYYYLEQISYPTMQRLRKNLVHRTKEYLEGGLGCCYKKTEINIKIFINKIKTRMLEQCFIDSLCMFGGILASSYALIFFMSLNIMVILYLFFFYFSKLIVLLNEVLLSLLGIV